MTGPSPTFTVSGFLTPTERGTRIDARLGPLSRQLILIVALLVLGGLYGGASGAAVFLLAPAAIVWFAGYLLRFVRGADALDEPIESSPPAERNLPPETQLLLRGDRAHAEPWPLRLYMALMVSGAIIWVGGTFLFGLTWWVLAPAVIILVSTLLLFGGLDLQRVKGERTFIPFTLATAVVVIASIVGAPQITRYQQGASPSTAIEALVGATLVAAFLFALCIPALATPSHRARGLLSQVVLLLSAQELSSAKGDYSVDGWLTTGMSWAIGATVFGVVLGIIGGLAGLDSDMATGLALMAIIVGVLVQLGIGAAQAIRNRIGNRDGGRSEPRDG
jgi:hypothetical protein